MSLSRSGRSGQNSSAVLGFRHGVNAAESRPIEGTYSKCMGQLDPIWGMEYRLISRTCLHNPSSVQTSSGGGANWRKLRTGTSNFLEPAIDHHQHVRFLETGYKPGAVAWYIAKTGRSGSGLCVLLRCLR